jgi:hypothetical protein
MEKHLIMLIFGYAEQKALLEIDIAASCPVKCGVGRRCVERGSVEKARAENSRQLQG